MTENGNAPDRIEEICGALCQHGPLNRRIYLMNIKDATPARLIARLDALAEEKGYTKIFAKVPAAVGAPFFDNGYRKEAEVAKFFGGRNDALFLGRYFDDARRVATDAALLDQVAAASLARLENPKQPSPLPDGYRIRVCGPDDIAVMGRLYREVFPSYPFPIQDPDYLRETMTSHVVYFAVERDGEIVALSSSEMDVENRNVEMTDFATSPEARGKKLAVHLLRAMETEMTGQGMRCAYTIARAVSFSMNFTFADVGYRYGGRLVNNTNISGNIESMTVWHKILG